MRTGIELTERGTAGPRVLLLPGLGARGSGFGRLAAQLEAVCRPVLVEYPEGPHAGEGAGPLAARLAVAAGPFDAVVASSFAGLVAAHLAAAGHVQSLAFLGSFTHPEQLGLRGRAFGLMGPIATWGRPGAVAAALAAAAPVSAADVPHLVPTTRLERESVVHRARAVATEPPPPPLSGLALRCLVIQGGLDLLVPPSTALRLAAALPAGTACHPLPFAGHVPYFTHARACAALLHPWLAGVAAADLALAG